MKLFIALLFEEEQKNIIYDILQEIKLISRSGNFTAYKNLHLTLEYIGETSKEQLEVIKNTLSEIDFKTFNYVTNKIKCFSKSDNQKIVYLGVDYSDTLRELYHRIVDQLNKAGYNFGYEKLTPHITLGRKVYFKEFETVRNIYCNPLTILADHICIMESKKIDGKIVYEELYSIPLK